MSREWVDDHKPPPPCGHPDTRDRRWVMRCDVEHPSGKRCPTESEPSHQQPPLLRFHDAGWSIAEKHGDVCPSCLSAGYRPSTPRWTPPEKKEQS